MRIIYKDQTWELEGPMTVQEAIKAIGFTPHTMLAVQDGELLKKDTLLQPDDEVKLVRVIVGG
jgi:sulfur carrier protein ThiS